MIALYSCESWMILTEKSQKLHSVVLHNMDVENNLGVQSHKFEGVGKSGETNASIMTIQKRRDNLIGHILYHEVFESSHWMQSRRE